VAKLPEYVDELIALKPDLLAGNGPKTDARH
jgi:hypothetical protein